MTNLYRKSHLLGTKVKNIRKINKLTLEDLSERCSQDDPKKAPSVSYLSMIENGKRLPSSDVLEQIARVFQKEPTWFLDENLDMGIPEQHQSNQHKSSTLPLEPKLLYSRDLLQGAIPELLKQTGISGKQFAHLLIRSYQEQNQNRFPDLEKAADEIGNKLFPVKIKDIKNLYKKHGLTIKWFKQNKVTTSAPQIENKMLLRSFFESPSEVYVNEHLKDDPQRLKYDLATHLGHKILHQGDGLRSPISSGSNAFNSQHQHGRDVNSYDVLSAWHDFESSFFASALLCPKKPFHSYLIKKKHQILSAKELELSHALMMRRVTAVSNYPYWHYFEAYQPGYLTAVYRANGIPLPWGNMAMVSDPCPNWAVFRILNESHVDNPQTQISVLKNENETYLYCCYSIRLRDLAGNLKLYSLGIDLIPAIKNQGIDATQLLSDLVEACQQGGGEAEVHSETKEVIEKISHILRIEWLKDSLSFPARIICPRSSNCQRENKCAPSRTQYKFNEIDELKENILMLKKADLI